jgi:hypothetical protein
LHYWVFILGLILIFFSFFPIGDDWGFYFVWLGLNN